uniref:Cytochrome P450, family 1, subfamily C, polypeptide 2 n=1 Tax=Sinocyclocheilus anshuiensis TaxID=1608454 RepID=A0A671LU94_9TELE
THHSKWGVTNTVTIYAKTNLQSFRISWRFQTQSSPSLHLSPSSAVWRLVSGSGTSLSKRGFQGPSLGCFQSVSGGTSMTFTNYSKQWKMHRRIAQSTIRAFSSANSQTKKSFEKHIAAEAEELIEAFLRLSSNNQYFNPSHELTVAAANIICALCFGKRYGHDDLEFRTLLRRVDKFGETVGAGSLVDVMPWLQSFPNPVRSVFQNVKDLNKDFFTFVKGKVVEHRQSYDPEVTRDMSDAFIGVIDHADMETGLTEAHTEGTVSDLIGAGLDTISTALHWMLLLLVKYPSIQTKLQDCATSDGLVFLLGLIYKILLELDIGKLFN